MNITYSNYTELKSAIDFKVLPKSFTDIVPDIEALDDYFDAYNEDDKIYAKAFDKALLTINTANANIDQSTKETQIKLPLVETKTEIKAVVKVKTSKKPSEKIASVKPKFKKGDFVQKTANNNLKGTIVKAVTDHPDLAISYSVKTETGQSEYWFESDIEKTKKPAKLKPGKHGHPMIPDDIKLLRRVRHLINKTKTKRDFLLVLNAIERADVQRQVTKTSKFAKELNYSLDWLSKIINHLESTGEPDKFAMKDKEIENAIMDAATGNEVLEAVRILKQFIAIQGRPDSKQSAQKLLARIEKYETNDNNAEHYSKHLTEIKSTLKKYLNSQSKTMAISSYTLSGIADKCGCTLHDLGYINTDNTDFLIKPPIKSALSPSAAMHGFGEITLTDQPADLIYNMNEPRELIDPNNGGIPLDKVKTTNNGFRLSGDLGKFIGPIALNKYAIVIKGDSGAGKSRFALQLANSMAAIIGKEAYFSLEMSPSNPEIKREYFDKYIAPVHRPKILTFDEGSLNKVKDLATKGVRAIFVDSWQKLYEKSSEFGLLRNQFPGTAFIIIFQETTSGKARGGSESIYDSDLVIHVHKSPDGDYKKNYAQAEKNRFAGTDMRYNIFTGKLI